MDLSDIRKLQYKSGGYFRLPASVGVKSPIIHAPELVEILLAEIDKRTEEIRRLSNLEQVLNDRLRGANNHRELVVSQKQNEINSLRQELNRNLEDFTQSYTKCELTTVKKCIEIIRTCNSPAELVGSTTAMYEIYKHFGLEGGI